MTTMYDLAFLLAGLEIGLLIRRYVPMYKVEWIEVDDDGESERPQDSAGSKTQRLPSRGEVDRR